MGVEAISTGERRGALADLGDARTIGAALAIAGAAFFLIGGYEFIRSPSQSLYIQAYGSQKLPIVMALGAVGTLVFLYLYGVILSWVGAKRALLITSFLCGITIVACYLAIRAGSNVAVGVLYVVREGYIVLLVEQYWSFINSTLRTGQARWLNGPICGVASVGAIVGGLTAGRLATPLGTETLLLFAAGTLVPAGILSAVAYHVAGEPKPTEEERKARKGQLALGLFLRNRILLYLALLIATTQVVSTVLDLRFSMLLEKTIPHLDQRTAFLGTYWGRLNGVTFFLQFMLTPLLLRLCPLRLVHAAIPVVHLAACAALLAHPTLFTSGLAFLLFKSLDYSAFRAGKEIFYIPLSFEARYRAKQVIDAFGYRASKGIMSGLLDAAGRIFGRLPGATYPILAMGSAVAWLFFVMRLTAKPSGRPAEVRNAGPHC